MQYATFVLLGISSAVTLFTIVWTAGKVSGSIETQIASLERRISDIEHGLRRQGVKVRQP